MDLRKKCWIVITKTSEGEERRKTFDSKTGLQEAYAYYLKECENNTCHMYYDNGQTPWEDHPYVDNENGDPGLARIDLDEKIRKSRSPEEAAEWEKLRGTETDGAYYRSENVYLMFQAECGHWFHGEATPYSHLSEEESNKQLLYEASCSPCLECITGEWRQIVKKWDKKVVEKFGEEAVAEEEKKFEEEFGDRIKALKGES